MRILHVNNLLPIEPMDGGRLRKLQHLEALAHEHDLWVLGRSPDLAARDALARAHPGWRIITVPESDDPSRNPIVGALRELTSRQAFDVVVVSGFAQWPGDRALGAAHVILDIDSLDGTVLQRMRDTDRSLTSAFDIAATEALTRTVCNRADLVLACSEVDAAHLRRLARHARVEVIANALDGSAFAGLGPPPRRSPPVVTFTGFLSYWPNADGCAFFIAEVLPLLRQLVPDVRVRMVGRVPPESLVTLAAAHDVELHADVPDIRPWFATSDVMIAPLRVGSGTRLKILEAFAAGRPVVSTSIGCEGLEVEHGTHLLVADAPADFASAVARVLGTPALSALLVEHAAALFHARYERTALAERLRQLVAGLDGTTPRGPAVRSRDL